MVYPMNGSELIKILRKLGKQRGLTVRIDKKRGRGSHFTLYFGDNRTIMKDRTKEISSGLLKKLLDNLGLSRDDIR
jgi:mRNA interferase HicA